MKSREIVLSNSLSCVVEALEEVESTSAQAGFDREQANLLRLLTEEMLSMTMDILKECSGVLWMEWEGFACMLHLAAIAPMDPAAKAAFLQMSKEKGNAAGKGIKQRIGALIAGLLANMEFMVYSPNMRGGFIGGPVPTWSLAAYERTCTEQERQKELDGVERSILNGMADDIVVSVKGNQVELVVKKQFSAPAKAAMPKFTGMSHICIVVDNMEAAVTYYHKLLGAEPDHYLAHWKNHGFFKAAGFLHQYAQGEVSIAFIRVPGTKLTLELMQYHCPEGRKEPVRFAANDVSGARHVALKVTNIEEAFLHVKSMPDTRLICEANGYHVFQISETKPSEVRFFAPSLRESDQHNLQAAAVLSQVRGYRVFQISETKPSEVRFFDQDLRESDQRNLQAAQILSQVRCFYFIDKYGLQWEFEQGHTNIGD